MAGFFDIEAMIKKMMPQEKMDKFFDGIAKFTAFQETALNGIGQNTVSLNNKLNRILANQEAIMNHLNIERPVYERNGNNVISLDHRNRDGNVA